MNASTDHPCHHFPPPMVVEAPSESLQLDRIEPEELVKYLGEIFHPMKPGVLTAV